MIAELGYAATVVGFVLALYGAMASVIGVRTGRADWLRTGERAAVGIWIFCHGCCATAPIEQIATNPVTNFFINNSRV